MIDHTGDIKKYIHTSKTWYAASALSYESNLVDYVVFGFFAPGGGTSGEMRVEWREIKRGKLTPCLRCQDDAWHALSQLQDVIDKMAEVNNQDISPTDFCILLSSCGFIDGTPYKYEDTYPRQNGRKG